MKIFAHRVPLSVGVGLFLLVPTLVSAESGPLGWGEARFQQDLETDRPDFTEGTQTIQSGHLQFELGYTYSEDGDGQDLEEHLAPELLTRIGLAPDLELRLAWGGYAYSDIEGPSGENSTEDGVTDASIGFKHRMYSQEDSLADFSLIAELSLPVGSSEFTADEIVPAIKFLWAYDFENFSLAGNSNFAGPIGVDGRYLELSSSLACGTELTNSLGIYAEYFGFYPSEDVAETTEHYTNAGFTFGLSDDLQLDVRAGFGLNDAADDFFTGAGLSVRI